MKVIISCCLLLICGNSAFSQKAAWDSLTVPDIYPYQVELFNSMAHSKKDIVFLGNSITFWGDWNELIQAKHIKNRGIPGDVTFGVLRRLDEVIDGKPAKVFILIGINDLGRKIPDDVILQNYERMVKRIKTGSPVTRIYLQTLLPTNDSFNKLKHLYSKEANIAYINSQMKELARREKVTFVDLHSHFIDEQGKLKKEYTWDGVHLTLAGYRKWAEVLDKAGYVKAKTPRIVPEVLKKQALQTLREVMNTQAEWVKVHAAEFLIWSGNPEGVKDEFLRQEKLFGDKSQYRIGIGRVLAQTAKPKAEKEVYTDKILQAFLDLDGIDRIHAVETLGKLKISPLKYSEETTREALKSSNESLALYTRWSVAFTSHDSLKSTKNELLRLLREGKASKAAEGTIAYILRNLGDLTVSQWRELATTVLSKPDPNVYKYSAVWVTAPKTVFGSSELKQVHEELLKFSNSPSKADRMEMCMALAAKSEKEDLLVLVALLNETDPLLSDSDNADVKAGAAYAILKNVK